MMDKDDLRRDSLRDGLKVKGRSRREAAARHAEAEKGTKPRRNDILPSLQIEPYPVDGLKSHVRKLRKSDPAHIREIANSISAVFPDMRIKRETDREISTTAHGKRYATSLEGTLTGLGGNLIIIDDPIKLGDAFSEVVRKRSVDWYRSTLVTRPDDKKASRIVVVMQRVHQEDLVGYLQENEDFEVLNLPAIATSLCRHQTGPNRYYVRYPGDILHPKHEPVEALLALKKSMGLMAFSAQYQQTPVPVGGTYIKSPTQKSRPRLEDRLF
jgi:hypothetical protein